MIITPRFVFLHLHKSGGTFVNQILATIFPQARTYGYHAPRTSIPARFGHLPVIGTVRNPWSYYVSWYFFQKNRKQQNALFRTVSDGGVLTFCETIANLVDIGNRPRRYAQFVAELPDELPNRGLNLNKASVAALAGYESGFYTYLAEYIYGDLDAVQIMQMENLREELLKVLRQFDAPMDNSVVDMIRDGEKRNTSDHAEYTSYYDDETRELVARRDANLIERFGYRFGG